MELTKYDGNFENCYTLNSPLVRNYLIDANYNFSGKVSSQFIKFENERCQFTDCVDINSLTLLIFKDKGFHLTPYGKTFVATPEILLRRNGASLLTINVVKKMVPNYKEYGSVKFITQPDKHIATVAVEDLFDCSSVSKKEYIRNITDTLKTTLEKVPDNTRLYVEHEEQSSDINFYTSKETIVIENDDAILKRIQDTIKLTLEKKKKIDNLSELLKDPDMVSYIKGLNL